MDPHLLCKSVVNVEWEGERVSLAERQEGMDVASIGAADKAKKNFFFFTLVEILENEKFDCTSNNNGTQLYTIDWILIVRSIECLSLIALKNSSEQEMDRN